VSPDQIAALGAFLSGISSVLSAAWYARRQRKNARLECDARIAEIDKALHEGIEIARGTSGSDQVHPDVRAARDDDPVRRRRGFPGIAGARDRDSDAE